MRDQPQTCNPELVILIVHTTEGCLTPLRAFMLTTCLVPTASTLCRAAPLVMVLSSYICWVRRDPPEEWPDVPWSQAEVHCAAELGPHEAGQNVIQQDVRCSHSPYITDRMILPGETTLMTAPSVKRPFLTFEQSRRGDCGPSVPPPSGRTWAMH